jgi:uncharacterized protein
MTFARRSCGECTLCCKLPEIVWPTDPPVGRPPLNKPMNTLCQYCVEGKGCTIWPERPISCAGFQCLWLMGFMGDDMRPDKVGGFFDVQGQYLLLLRDPVRPDPLDDPRVKRWADDFAKTRGRRLKVVKVKTPRQARTTG